MRGVVVAFAWMSAVAACSSGYGAADAPDAARPDGSASDGGASDGGASDAGDCVAKPGEIAFTSPGQVNSVVLDWANAPLLPAIETGGPCPANTGTETLPSRAYVLVNGTGAPAKPSAWGVCNTSFDEINVVFYARSTPPQTAVELQGCTGYAGVGSTTGTSPSSSPEDVGSGYCNGLAAKDVGLTLAPCERAVVLFQHDPNTFPGQPPGPAGARMKLE